MSQPTTTPTRSPAVTPPADVSAEERELRALLNRVMDDPLVPVKDSLNELGAQSNKLKKDLDEVIRTQKSLDGRLREIGAKLDGHETEFSDLTERVEVVQAGMGRLERQVVELLAGLKDLDATTTSGLAAAVQEVRALVTLDLETALLPQQQTLNTHLAELSARFHGFDASLATGLAAAAQDVHTLVAADLEAALRQQREAQTLHLAEQVADLRKWIEESNIAHAAQVETTAANGRQQFILLFSLCLLQTVGTVCLLAWFLFSPNGP